MRDITEPAPEALTGGLDPRSVMAKVMAVLHSFGADDRCVSLAELTRRTGIPKSTTHRICSDLVTARLLYLANDGYRLGGHLFELGMRASVERGLVDVATPFMEDLYELTHETVHLGVREASEVMYVAKIGGHHQAAAPSRVGGRLPLHCTAIGKVLLAHAPAEVVDTYLSGALERRAPRTVVAPGFFANSSNRSARQAWPTSSRSPRRASCAPPRRSSTSITE